MPNSLVTLSSTATVETLALVVSYSSEWYKSDSELCQSNCLSVVDGFVKEEEEKV